MHNIDLLIDARWVVTVNLNNDVLDNHSVAIDKGRIIDILPSSVACDRYIAKTHHQLGNTVLMPGLINCHTHAAMSLLKGIADDLPLMDWLQNHIWPAEGRWVNEEFVHDGTELAIAEMLRSGTTCFSDMYFFPDVIAKVVNQSGMRAAIGMIVLDFPTVWAQNADEYIEKGLRLRDEYREHSRIKTLFAPHAPYTVSEATLSQIRMLSDEMELPVTMHIHETQSEVDQAVANNDKRPLSSLHDIGLISPNLIAVHMTALTDEEINLLADNGTHIVHCPESNLKLASGFCPLGKLLAAEINVCLGTDGSASNNDLDMLGEMKTAALLAKAVSGDASCADANQIIRMATINGAKALGMNDDIGSIEIGKAADLIAVDFSGLESQPVYNPVSHLIFNTSRDQVSDVWVKGRHLLKDRSLTRLDENEIIRKTRVWNDKIANK
ncbi:MAG: TRZ/ATZ family hydrolase [Gammaproteobacteria bacterium]|nr:TRZ/ATZ family hydrolase [Gammaproteobacteria bacterium]